MYNETDFNKALNEFKRVMIYYPTTLNFGLYFERICEIRPIYYGIIAN